MRIRYYGVDGNIHLAYEGHDVGSLAERNFVRAKILTGHHKGSLQTMLEPCGGKVFFENPTAYLLWTGSTLPEKNLKTYLDHHKLGPLYTYNVPPSSYSRWFRVCRNYLDLSEKKMDDVLRRHDYRRAWYRTMKVPPPWEPYSCNVDAVYYDNVAGVYYDSDDALSWINV